MKNEELKDTKICTDLKVIMKTELPIAGKTYKGKLTYEDDFHQTFEEEEPRKRVSVGKSQSQTTLDRTAHGKISVDDYGAHVYFYFPFTEFNKNTWLAETLEAEAELMGDRIVEMEAICR